MSLVFLQMSMQIQLGLPRVSEVETEAELMLKIYLPDIISLLSLIYLYVF